ncbi:unnamed protein product [Musa acuminata subsp. malaccensis]|uniref:(wild Malaysian banana) hypothetical protein n=1 Tax=Musa acuminata subsp. malaccensis TaxID=214687 RepID=A0A804IXN8_MUSAM|nr:PREDICTED: eukaryotic translation initiation factor 4B3-like [Musa acuminata subsp. malaccensis]CAG1844400.1 unnamed protein product [Musa acuminata subsp. malaccensis]
MAASVSAWAKPGAWALDAEEHEATMTKGDENASSETAQQQQDDFPSLAASKTPKKKKKAQAVSLAQFTTGRPVSHGAAGRVSSSSKGLTSDELLLLPTGPRERSAEELERSSARGFGYAYGARGRASGEDTNPTRWGSSRVSDEPRRGGFEGSGGGSNRDLEPSRADEIDDWGAAKKSFVPQRRERGGGGGGFFESQSRADESDSWISSKSVAAPPDGRRIGAGSGFDGPRSRMDGFEMFNKEGSNGGRADSESWGRKKDFTDSETWKRDEERSSGGRRRLVLQHRSLPLSNANTGEQALGEQEKESTEKKSRGSNPFGGARPREDVLAEKGQDWKKIDEKLEAMKIHNASLEKTSFGVTNGTRRSPENHTDGAWRKPETAEASPLREDKIESTVPEN